MRIFLLAGLLSGAAMAQSLATDPPPILQIVRKPGTAGASIRPYASAKAQVSGVEQYTIQSTTILAGASLHLLPLGDVPNPISGLYPSSGATNFTLDNNFAISGLGITHPFAGISGQGAIVSLAGTNTLTGFITLNSIAGIGVQQLEIDFEIAGEFHEGRNLR